MHPVLASQAPASSAPTGVAPVTLFRLDGCPVAAILRPLFAGLGVPYVEVPLGRPHTPGDACGFVSPAVQIHLRRSGPELLVQRSEADLLEALGRAGLVREPRGAGGTSRLRSPSPQR